MAEFFTRVLPGKKDAILREGKIVILRKVELDDNYFPSSYYEVMSGHLNPARSRRLNVGDTYMLRELDDRWRRSYPSELRQVGIGECPKCEQAYRGTDYLCDRCRYGH
jgi:hypothetical protein